MVENWYACVSVTSEISVESDNYTSVQIVWELVNVLRRHQLQLVGAHFIAHSYGTFILSHMLHLYPNLVKSALLCDPVCAFFSHNPSVECLYLFASTCCACFQCQQFIVHHLLSKIILGDKTLR
jgi:pimeloyl-ACP methyl ester carboxylesterase